MLRKHFQCLSNTYKLHNHVMLSMNILYIVSRDLFHVQYNNQDSSCSITLQNTENKLYH